MKSNKKLMKCLGWGASDCRKEFLTTPENRICDKCKRDWHPEALDIIKPLVGMERIDKKSGAQ